MLVILKRLLDTQDFGLIVKPVILGLMTELIIPTKSGLYCEQGQFYIDPWLPVDKAIITHAHSDHLRPGNGLYISAKPNEYLFRTRLGDNIKADFIDYNQVTNVNGVQVSLHPAGHILGSAQIKLVYKDEIWVVSGDYKLQEDKTCLPMEPIFCHTFITESTFALPVYRWQSNEEIFQEINQWWSDNKEDGLTTILFCYALGKAQRILTGLDTTIGPIFTHGAVENLTQDFRKIGINLPPTSYVGDIERRSKSTFAGGIVLAPPSAMGSPWLKKFVPYSTGLASGWMRIRGTRRRKSIDRGFALSDHADWPGLLKAIASSGASRVIVTHGNAQVMVHWLKEKGLQAEAFSTEFVGETE